MRRIFAGSEIGLEQMYSLPHPFHFLRQFPSGMPRDIATSFNLQQIWEATDEDRQLSRGLYIHWILTEKRNNQIRLAFRTAALVCSLGSGQLFPTEAVIRILEYMVVTRYEIMLPAVLVRQPINLMELDYFFLVAGGFDRVNLERAASMHEDERLSLETCFEYLCNGVTSAEHRRDRIECDLLGFGGRRLPGELNQWILELRFDNLIRE